MKKQKPHTQGSIPEPELSIEELEWAVAIWKDPASHNPDEIRQAASICRRWHADRKDLLRRASRGTDIWNDLKHEEELLEMYVVDLKEAIITAMHNNRMAQFGG